MYPCTPHTKPLSLRCSVAVAAGGQLCSDELLCKLCCLPGRAQGASPRQVRMGRTQLTGNPIAPHPHFCLPQQIFRGSILLIYASMENTGNFTHEGSLAQWPQHCGAARPRFHSEHQHSHTLEWQLFPLSVC